MNTQHTFILTNEQIDKILNYLATKPYAEVVGLVSMVMQTCGEQSKKAQEAELKKEE